MGKVSQLTLLYLLTTTTLFSATYIVTQGGDTASTSGGSGSGTSGDLRFCINAINAASYSSSGTYTLLFDLPAGQETITLQGLLSPLNLYSTNTLAIEGHTRGGVHTTIDGNSLYRGLFAHQGTLSIHNLSLNNCSAIGGSGSGGGGGLGGALFVNTAHVTLSNVSFSNNSCIGGSGTSASNTTLAGGGGLGGSGSVNGHTNNLSGGGGGGFSGNGGPPSTSLNAGAGGGGLADGGVAVASTGVGGAGGGGALLGLADGGTSATAGSGISTVYGGGGGGASFSQTTPGAGGGPGIGGSGGVANTAGSPGVAGGGGGGGGYSTGVPAGGHGGSGGVGGGGGGGGAGSSGLGGDGGSGNTFGGGGGGGSSGIGNPTTSGGAGGFGGGGGGAGNINGPSTPNSTGGAGNFGGGGGAALPSATSSTGGNGGFAGGGGTGRTTGGTGGTGAGSNGGGGAGLGGAIFVNTGQLTIGDNVSIDGGAVTGGVGSQPGTNDGGFAGAGIFIVSSMPSTLIFAPSSGTTVTLNNPISDASISSLPGGLTFTPGSGIGATLTMNGAGTLILSASNTYQQGTFVNAGTVVVSGSVIAPATIQTGTLTISGSMTGNATVTNRGTLNVPGFVSGDASISGQSLLSGNGTVSGSVSIQGSTLFPNVPSQALSVNTVTFDPSSAFQIEIVGEAASELLVSTNAALAGTVQVALPDLILLPQSATYTILSAGSISGSFNPTAVALKSFVTLPGLSLSVTQTATNVFLSLIWNPYLPTEGLTGNEKRVADYLNRYGARSTILLFNELSPEEYKKALDAVSPARNAFAPYIIEKLGFTLNQNLSSHLEQVHDANLGLYEARLGDPCAAPCPNNTSNAWISGFQQWAGRKKEEQNPAFSYRTSSVLAGWDYKTYREDLVGVAAGYTHTPFWEKYHLGHADIDCYFASAYGSWALGPFWFSPVLLGLFDQVHNTRTIAFGTFSKEARSSYSGGALIPHLDIRCEIEQSWGACGPFAAGDFAFLWQNGYKEHGAAPFNATQKDHLSRAFRVEAGLFCYKMWERETSQYLLKQKLSYVMEKPYERPSVTSSFTGISPTFTVFALSEQESFGCFGVELIGNLFGRAKSAPWTLSLGYEGLLGPSYWAQDVTVSINKRF